MRIHIATDHAGLETSHYLMQELTNLGHEVFDHGPQSFDPLDDYPAFCINAALAVQRDLQAEVPALGIVLGGSGNGEHPTWFKVALNLVDVNIVSVLPKQAQRMA